MTMTEQETQKALPEFPLPVISDSPSGLFTYDFVRAAQAGMSYTALEWAWHIKANRGIVSAKAWHLIHKTGWTIQQPARRGGMLVGDQRYVLLSVDGKRPTEYAQVGEPWEGMEPVPEDFVETGSPKPRQGGRRKGSKYVPKKVPTPPPFGVDLTITKGELYGNDVLVTLDRKWTGVIEGKELFLLGDKVQAIGAGLAEDGLWVNTTQFTIRQVK